MTDDERIDRIDKIYEDMSDKCAFVKAFGNDAISLSIQREKEAREIELIRKNNDIL
jgi:hypothetical protein